MNRKSIIDKLLDRWYIKFFCLVISILLLIYHQTSMIEKKTFTIPLHVIEDGIVLHVGSLQSSVAVVIRTDPENMKTIMNSDIRASINLNTITKAGVHEIPVDISISEKLMELDPFELRVKDPTVKVSVDLKGIKYVKLEPSIIGEVAHGYTISEIKMNPSSVLISGPMSILDSLDSIPTTKINVSNAEKTFTTETNYLQNTSLYKVDEEGPYKATIIVEAEPYEREFSQISVEVLNLPENLEISRDLPLVNVKLAGVMPVLESYNLSSHFVQLDCSKITEPGEYELKLKYNIPKNFDLVEAPYQNILISVVEKTEGGEEASESSGD